LAKTVPLRSEVPVELTWDLASIFRSDQAWEEAFADVEGQLDAVRQLQGSLGHSARDLYLGLVLRDQVGEALDRVAEYANRRHYEDMGNMEYAAYADRVTGLASAFAAATSFFAPEILEIAPEQLAQFFLDEPALAVYRHLIETITVHRPHTRSTEIEQLLAGVSEVAQGPERVFEAILNLDRRLPTITDADGSEVQLTTSTYHTLLQSPNRDVRRAAFEGMLGTFEQQQHTLAATLSTQVKKDLFFARARNYESALEAAMDSTHIPAKVYDTLVQTVNANLPSLHRYVALRERILALGEPLHMYDLYAPLVSEVDLEVSYQEASDQVMRALAPLGTEYVSALQRGLRSRWIDVVESQGKLSGAYSAGAYGTHPFISLNYQSRRNDVFTLAHELGHSMHSHFTNNMQPYHYTQYTTFLAEIASTLNEALLRHYLLQKTGDKMQRASIINQYLENFRATVFRQTMFAEFEQLIHAEVEAGGSLTAESIQAIYRGLVTRYYGAAGVIVDDLIANEWSIIPHFYLDFYVYQYATGFAASAALAGKILTEGPPAVERYLQLLQSGSSNYSIDLLKEAGIDMTTAAPIEAALSEFDQAVAELDALV
jgi:oligoendopeptidase F